MVEATLGSFDKIIKSAEQLGALPTSSVFALVCVYLGWILKKKTEQDAINSENWRRTREDGIQVEAEQTEVLKRLADGQMMMKSDVSTIKTVLDERLPRK